MIQEVEKELSLSLLERGRGGVRLTAEGTKLLPQMKTLCLPVRPDLDTIFLERDDFLAILPATHPLAQAECIFLDALCKEPFLMLEKDKNAEIADFFRREGLSPNVRFTTWDDYAILSIVESGLGVSLLPRLILKRIPYQVAAKETAPSFHRDIVLALRDRKTAPLAVRRFLEYLPYR